MRVLGYMPLLYGKDYLKYSLLSVYDQLDQILILYTDKPSHGSGTNLRCLDSQEELHAIAKGIDKDNKVKWYHSNWAAENYQRNFAHDYAKKHGFDILVSVDFDEVWKTHILKDLIQEVYDRKANKCLVWMRHLWKSFNYICDDAMRQERIYYTGKDSKDLIYASQPENQVWHFGYARKPVDVEYKISIHGHSREWTTPKEKWMRDKFKAWPPVPDVHPTCVNTWNPKPFNKEELPEIMKAHPYYNLEVI